jgi:hypothetical protein
VPEVESTTFGKAIAAVIRESNCTFVSWSGLGSVPSESATVDVIVCHRTTWQLCPAAVRPELSTGFHWGGSHTDLCHESRKAFRARSARTECHDVTGRNVTPDCEYGLGRLRRPAVRRRRPVKLIKTCSISLVMKLHPAVVVVNICQIGDLARILDRGHPNLGSRNCRSRSHRSHR